MAGTSKCAEILSSPAPGLSLLEALRPPLSPHDLSSDSWGGIGVLWDQLHNRGLR